MDGIFSHPVEVRAAGAIGTSETGDFLVGNSFQRIGQLTFQGIACPDRQSEVNLRMGTEVIDMPEELFPFSLIEKGSSLLLILSDD